LEGGAEIYAAGSPPKDGFELTAFLADRSMFTIADAGKVQGWVSAALPITPRHAKQNHKAPSAPAT